MNPWIYQGQPFTEAPEDCFGFVYRITLPDGRDYVGKKGFWKKGKTKVVKVSAKAKRTGKVKDMSPEEQAARLKTRRDVSESDWRNYLSSGEEVKRFIATNGKDSIKREILQLSPKTGKDGKGGSGLLSYYELVWQLRLDSHLRSNSLNGMTNVRLGRNVFPQWLKDGADAKAKEAA